MIDVHTHIFDEEVYQQYRERSKRKVEKAVTIHYFCRFDSVGNEELKLEDLLQFAQDKPDLVVAASADLTADVESQVSKLDNLFASGAIVAVKLYPGYQHVSVSDPKAEAFARLCAKHRRPLIIHTGDVYDPTGAALLKYSHPLHVDELAVLVPECSIIVGHFGFPYLLETAMVMAKHMNVYADLSGTINSQNNSDAGKLANQYGLDLRRVFNYYPEVRGKILFGTDYTGEKFPLKWFDEYANVVNEVFSENERERVFGGLARKLFGL